MVRRLLTGLHRDSDTIKNSGNLHRIMKLTHAIGALALFITSLPSPAAAEMPRVFFEKHCFDCHDATELFGEGTEKSGKFRALIDGHLVERAEPDGKPPLKENASW